jgi:hypothetical protein
VSLLIGCPPLPVQYITSYSPYLEVHNLRRRRAFAKRNPTSTWEVDYNKSDNQDKDCDDSKSKIIKSFIKALADNKNL